MRRSNKPTSNFKKKSRDTENIANILPIVGRMLNLDNKVQEFSVLALWDRVIEPRFQGQCRAIKLRRTGEKVSLLVQVNSAAVATELSFSLQQYCQKLNQFSPQTGMTIHQVDLTVG